MTDLDYSNETTALPDALGAPHPEGASASSRFARWNSPAVWNRIALGFAALCFVKIIMLVCLRRELFEIHWRVSDEAPTWLNAFSFYLFAVLVGVNLWKFSERCMQAGVRVVRAANACVLFLGALFIFLTLHSGDKNYLYAVMSDIWSWGDVLSNLYTLSCFDAPFLAAWLLGYAFVYYVMCRKGREQFMLRLTAVCATVYILLFLRGFSEYRNALIVLDCLGIACLVFNGSGSLNPFYMALPALCGASLFFLFRPFSAGLGLTGMNPEFSVLLWVLVLSLVGITAIAWKRGFLCGWWRILPFVTAALLLINSNYPAAANYENLLCMGFMLPRYFLGECVVMAALLLVAVGYRKIRPAGNLFWLDAIILLLVALALLDLRLTQIMGVRLDWDVISLATGETPKMMWRMARPYLPALALALVVIAGVYALLLWALGGVGRIRLRALNPGTNATPEISSPSPPQKEGRAGVRRPLGFRGRASGARSLCFAIVACVLLGVAGISLAPGDKAEGQTLVRFAETSPLLKHNSTPLMDKTTFLKTAADLGMGNLAAPAPPPTHAPRDLNVVLIFQESTYNKHLSLFGSAEDTQPLLSQYKDRMELFPNFFSVFAGSMNARFATFTGLYPLGDYHAFTAQRVPVKSIFETLHDHGYACSMFYSSFFDYTDFRDFLRNRGIEGMYDADTMPGTRTNAPVSWGLQEEETLGAICSQIKTCATNKQKFFLTYVPAAPHNPFDGTPQRFQKRKMNKIGDLTPFYFNELLYMDWTISSIIDQLKQSGLLDNTLVVITADHGEMLGENGGPVGHGWAMTPVLANVPLMIMDPGHPGYRVNDTIGSQVDLMPTILDLLGIPVPQGQICQGTSLYSPDLNTNRTIYINTFRQYGIIQDSRFIQGDRETDGAGGTGSRAVFDISDQGPHTSFTQEQAPAPGAPSISAFDQFQKNLLRNYSDYNRMISASQN